MVSVCGAAPHPDLSPGDWGVGSGFLFCFFSVAVCVERRIGSRKRR